MPDQGPQPPGNVPPQQPGYGAPPGYGTPPGYPQQQYGLQPQYGGPQYGVAQQPGNGMAIAALVLGIIAVVFCWIPFLGIVLGALALIFGIVGNNRSKMIGGAGHGAAIAGLVLGIIGLALSVLLLLLIWGTIIGLHGAITTTP